MANTRSRLKFVQALIMATVGVVAIGIGTTAGPFRQASAAGSKTAVVFEIPSGAMEPTILIGDRVLVNELAYSHRSVHRGDIVVFRRPADENCGGAPVTDLIKRVIGLPGETISLSSSSYVVIDGKLLNETWLPDSAQGITFPGPAGPAYSLDKPYVIPRGDYFVMGDNRTDSCDSRYWGPIPKSLIVGKVEWLLRRPAT